MPIREIQERDRTWLEKHWSLDAGFAGGYVYVDGQDRPVMAVGGWRIFEVHSVADESFSTPGARMAALRELHVEMERKMIREGVGEAITFFDRVESTCKRLKQLGWQQVSKQVWGRRAGA